MGLFVIIHQFWNTFEHIDTDVQAKLVQTIVFDLLAKKNIQKVKSRVLLQTDLCHFCLSGKQHQGMSLHPSRGTLTGNTQGAKGSSKKPQKRRRESERDEDGAAEEASAQWAPENSGYIKEALAGMAEPTTHLVSISSPRSQPGSPSGL